MSMMKNVSRSKGNKPSAGQVGAPMTKAYTKGQKQRNSTPTPPHQKSK